MFIISYLLYCIIFIKLYIYILLLYIQGIPNLGKKTKYPVYEIQQSIRD